MMERLSRRQTPAGFLALQEVTLPLQTSRNPETCSIARLKHSFRFVSNLPHHRADHRTTEPVFGEK